MTTDAEFRLGLEKVRLVAIIRLLDHARVVEIAETLVAAGVQYLEVTIERDTGFDALKRVVTTCASSATVGAGTVLSPENVVRASDCGARFIVTPNVNPDVISAAHQLELPILPGAFTPSEVALAVECGAHFVKLFPASTGGIGHLRALRGPFHDVAFVPTGGIGADNLALWLDAGAVAVAMGSNLVSNDGSLVGLSERTHRAVMATKLDTAD